MKLWWCFQHRWCVWQECSQKVKIKGKASDEKCKHAVLKICSLRKMPIWLFFYSEKGNLFTRIVSSEPFDQFSMKKTALRFFLHVKKKRRGY